MDTETYQSDLKADRKNRVKTVGEGNGNLLQWGHKESDTIEWLQLQALIIIVMTIAANESIEGMV